MSPSSPSAGSREQIPTLAATSGPFLPLSLQPFDPRSSPHPAPGPETVFIGQEACNIPAEEKSLSEPVGGRPGARSQPPALSTADARKGRGKRAGGSPGGAGKCQSLPPTPGARLPCGTRIGRRALRGGASRKPRPPACGAEALGSPSSGPGGGLRLRLGPAAPLGCGSRSSHLLGAARRVAGSREAEGGGERQLARAFGPSSRSSPETAAAAPATRPRRAPCHSAPPPLSPACRGGEPGEPPRTAAAASPRRSRGAVP